MDIIAGDLTDKNLVWWKNSGDQNFTQYTIDNFFSWVYSIDTADINNDGSIDVVAAGYAENEIAWFSLTSFWYHKVVTDDLRFPGAEAVYPADIDGDGNFDILGTSSGNSDKRFNEFSWWRNDGRGNFSNFDKYNIDLIDNSSNGVSSVYATDIDGDNDFDVFGTIADEDAVVWWENLGNGIFGEMETIDTFTGPRMIYSADIDDANGPDVLVTGSDGICIYRNTDGEGLFGTAEFLQGPTYANAVHTADINGDGHVDILGAFNDYLVWWENDTTGNFLNPDLDYPSGCRHIISSTGSFAQPTSIYTEDFDGDKDIDVVATFLGSDKVAWFRNGDANGNGDGTSWTTNVLDDHMPATYGKTGVHASDIDGDGYTDIIAGSETLSRGKGIVWWKNTDGEGTFSKTQIISNEFRGISVFTSDTDNDGDLDIVSAGYNSGISLWENNLIEYGE
jgi:hypothetical protein